MIVDSGFTVGQILEELLIRQEEEREALDFRKIKFREKFCNAPKKSIWERIENLFAPFNNTGIHDAWRYNDVSGNKLSEIHRMISRLARHPKSSKVSLTLEEEDLIFTKIEPMWFDVAT